MGMVTSLKKSKVMDGAGNGAERAALQF